MDADAKVSGDDAVARQFAALAPALRRRIADLEASLPAAIIRDAQARAGRVGRQAARAARELGPARIAHGAAVQLAGSAITPWAVRAEYGSNTYPQFPRRWNPAGYWLSPAIENVDPQSQYVAALDEALREAGLDG